MANGTSRNALSQLVLKNKSASSQMTEEMAILAEGKGGKKIDLKASASSHNRSSEALHKRK